MRSPNRNDPELLAARRAHARAEDFELFVGDGWLPLVRACHAAIEAEFPDYELLAVKQKWAKLAFQAFPHPWQGPARRAWTDEEARRLDELVEAYAERSAVTCERCGDTAQPHTVANVHVTLCGACFAAAADD